MQKKISKGARSLAAILDQRLRSSRKKGYSHRGIKSRFAISCELLPSQLAHILTGRRRPTLEQAFHIHRQAGVEMTSWLQK